MGNLGVSQLGTAIVKQPVQQTGVTKAKQESVSFFDEAWSGHQIAKLTGDNVFTDWLQNKDKVCTDECDDGKIGFWEGTKSFAKGLIGGIPKMMINHPLATAAMAGIGAGAIALTGGAILPVLGAIGVATGVGMAGCGVYGALTARTDGEAKMALETMGTGVVTTALSIKSAAKTLEKASEAGVKSAQIGKNANIFQKTVQMFKSIPESLRMSKEWARFKLDLPITQEFNEIGAITKKTYGNDVFRTYQLRNEEAANLPCNYNLATEKLPNGTFRTYDYEFSDAQYLLEERYANGSYKKYNDNNLIEIGDGKGTYQKYDGYELIEEGTPDGAYNKYFNGKLEEEYLADGTHRVYRNDILVEETLENGTYRKYDIVDGTLLEEKISDKPCLRPKTNAARLMSPQKVSKEFIQQKLADGTYVRSEKNCYRAKLSDHVSSLYEDGSYTKLTAKDGSYIIVNDKTGIVVEEHFPDGTFTSRQTNCYRAALSDHVSSLYEDGSYTKLTARDGSYQIINDKTGVVVEEHFPDGTFTSRQTHCYRAKLSDHVSSLYEDGSYTKITARDGSYQIINDKTGVVVEEQFPDGTFTSRQTHCYRAKLSDHVSSLYEDGSYTKITARDGSYHIINDKTGVVVEEHFPDGTFTSRQTNCYRAALSDHVSSRYEEGSYTKITARDGSYKIINDETGEIVENVAAKESLPDTKSQNLTKKYTFMQSIQQFFKRIFG